MWQTRVELDPTDAGASERLGWVLWFTGRPAEALPWLEAAIALNPEGRWAPFYLGNAHLSLGDHDNAERAYRGALELDPDHSSAQAGVIWTLLAARKDDAARREVERFRSRPFDGDRYRLKLADIDYAVGDDDSALMHARVALDEPDARYWPRGILASTIAAAVLWPRDREEAELNLERSERVDNARLANGDEGYMPHVDLAAVAAIRGDASTTSRHIRAANSAGWRCDSFAKRDRLFGAA